MITFTLSLLSSLLLSLLSSGLFDLLSCLFLFSAGLSVFNMIKNVF